MAQCDWCKAEMTDLTTVTCKTNKTVAFPDRQVYSAIPYQDEDGLRCHDCNIAPGGYHHPRCDMEECPRCGGQLISCGCLSEL